jgi:hypothetical protein
VVDPLAWLTAPAGPTRWLVARARHDLEAVRSSPWLRAQVELIRLAAPAEWRGETFELPGICPVDTAAVRFRVEPLHDPQPDAPAPSLDFRERLFCPACGLNGRQRGLAYAALRLMESLAPGSTVLLLEQESPLFARLRERGGSLSLVGSEFLDTVRRPGEAVDGVRHEDACHLSFAAGALAAHLSTDVLEHVADPWLAFAEAHRCLAPGGVLLFTVPFHDDRDDSFCRVVWNDRGGPPRHLAPPIYHGDPRSPRGSLVVTEFGWDVLERLRYAGFQDAAAIVYWDPGCGFLHPLDFLFVATR